jgi:hypothetical protein
MAVDLQTFEPTYQLTERGAQVVSRLKTLVSRADQVLLATVTLHSNPVMTLLYYQSVSGN